MIRLVRVVRNVEFSRLFDDFFITAITTILIIRFYLKLAGYPQIGGSSLHIAHLLPGTLLMLAAILILLASVNRAVRDFCAILAGIGFGLAWDELGKFITKNNDYFFQATPGLIYLTFVILYLVVRYVAQRRLTQDDYMANVLDLLKDAAIKDLDAHEYEHAKELLAHVSPHHVLYPETVAMLEKVKPSPERQPSLLDKIIHVVKMPLMIISRQAIFPRLIITIAMIFGLASLVAGAVLLAASASGNIRDLNSLLRGDDSDLFGGLAMLASSAFSVLAIFYYVKGRHSRSFRFFEQALLVNIFIGQVILFFKSQTAALAWLAITIFLLLNLKAIATQEAREKVNRHANPL